MAELSPTFGLVQKGQEKVWELCTGIGNFTLLHSLLSFPFPGSHWVFEPSLIV